MGELRWTARVCNQMRANGAIVQANVGDARSGKGWPDRTIVSHVIGAVVFLEFKDDETEVSAIQAYTIRQINQRAPGSAFIVRWPGSILYLYFDELGGWKFKEFTFDGRGDNLLVKLAIARADRLANKVMERVANGDDNKTD